MDRIWSNVGTRSSSADYPRRAEITLDPLKNTISEEGRSSLRIGDLVPDIIADSTQGKFELFKILGDKDVVLLGYPKDFHPVAATELAFLAKMRNEFEQRGATVAVVSPNLVEEHQDFVHDVESTDLPDGAPVWFHLISDPDQTISETFGMLMVDPKDPEAVPICCRSVHIIDKNKRLKFAALYPKQTGRNFKEIFRVMDSMDLCATYDLLTPANWTPGDLCAVRPDMQDPVAQSKFGPITKLDPASGRNYMRYVTDPEGRSKHQFSWGDLFKSVLGFGAGVVIGVISGRYTKMSKS